MDREEEILRLKFEANLASSVARAKKINAAPIIPVHYFTPSLVELREMFIGGYFIGVISLSQSVAEGLSRFLCERNGLPYSKRHEKRVRDLSSEGKITSESKDAFDAIHQGRNDFHHMNKNIATDRPALEARAELNVGHLSQIEKEIFSHSPSEGKLVPTKAQYWDVTDGTTQVHLNFPQTNYE